MSEQEQTMPEPTKEMLARTRRKFGAVMGADPIKKADEAETKTEEDVFDRLLVSSRSQQWLAAQATKVLADTKGTDLRRWKTRAVKAVKAGKSGAVRFESSLIPTAEQARITGLLVSAQSIADVVKACASETIEVKAADDLIDAEWDSAMAWAKKASEG